MDQSMKPKTSALTATLITILVVLIFAGGAYFYMNDKAEKEKSDLNAQITDLQNQISALKTSTTTSGFSTSATTATDETASWKTYTDDQYGYSFKYPTDWLVKDMTLANKHISGLLSFIGSNPKDIGEDSFYMVKITSNSLQSEVDKVIEGIDNNSNSELVSDKTIEKYGVNVRAITIKNKTTDAPYTDYYLSKNSKTYRLTGPRTDSEETTKISNKMVETFQFTK